VPFYQWFGSHLKLVLLLVPLLLQAWVPLAALAWNSVAWSLSDETFLAPAFASVIYGFALRPNWATLFEWKPLEFLGEASYSLYLLHSFIMGPFFNTQAGDPRHRSYGWICVYLVLAVSISGLVYRLIEVPARRKLRGTKKATAVPS